MARSSIWKVYIVVGIGLLAFATSPILVRFASYAPGLAIAAWRTLFAWIILTPIALPRIRPELRRFGKREWVLVVAAGVLLALHFILWIESLYFTSVASASVLVSSSPIFLALLGYIFLKEKPSLRTLVAIGMAVIGAILLNWGDLQQGAFPEAWWGNLLAVIAALFFSFYILIGRVIRQKTSWLGYVYPLYSVVAFTAVGIALFRHIPLYPYPWTFYLICLLLALGPQILGHGSFNYAVKYLPAALLGLLTLVEPVLASAFAWILFDEVPSLVALLGMGLILFAIGLALLPYPQRESRRSPGTPEENVGEEAPRNGVGSG